MRPTLLGVLVILAVILLASLLVTDERKNKRAKNIYGDY